MRLVGLSALVLSIGLIACSKAESEAQAPEPVVEVKQVEAAPVEQVAQIKSADDLVKKIKDDATKTPPTRVDLNTPVTCNGVFKQGGAVLCQTFPNSRVNAGGIVTNSDEDGQFLVGFDRDAPKEIEITVITSDIEQSAKFAVAPRKYDVQRIDGLPPSQVSTFTDKQLAHIKASSARKKVGFSSRSKEMGFRDGFTLAVTGTKSSDFGNQRILNGEAKRPHYGVDIAAPVGTPIYAPADGVVSLADDDLYFEGAMVLIDHGQGLISMYLHMSDIDVEAGQKVKRGDQIGAVGAKGRATGPHLCWRLKWRNRNLDPELLTQWPHD